MTNQFVRPTLQRCPACGYAGDFISLNHIRTVHGIATRDEFERTYGTLIEIDARVPPHIREWAREMSKDYMSKAHRRYIGIS
ncbi:DUF4442 domain-containing protein [Alicyclobacillus acidoterrestris]